MSFTKSWSSVEEEGVITFSGSIDNVFGGRKSKIIIRTDDEVIYSVFLIEAIIARGVVGDIFLDSINMVFDGGTSFGDFTRADFGFISVLDFKLYIGDSDVVVL